ncbi:virB8 family protein [Phenylobacterium sp.]|jgi:type IV secretion system protein VirB8|uniref:virB8 family protein n=1 Tax=Phenylobacterium sp. TaxID=1871053 RepID=UPI002E342AEC|nr:VirB8/TrbF family protein [Phenylobacterium sp.]HEX2560193.1 VirB8/TrbF family protein [Phenylobacterium sp.]
MKPEKPPAADRQAYYADAASWSRDVQGSLRTSRRVAWIVAGVAGAIALLEGAALAALTPLKSVVPYAITVDRQTGYVETAKALEPGTLSQNAAVTQAFLAQYVLSREGYDTTDLQAAYGRVAQWSVGDAKTQYLAAMAPSNPQSPVKLLGTDTVLHPTVKSISMLSPTSALVRFDVERRTYGATLGERHSYAAVIGFRYTGEPMRMEDRFLNPLGFQVTSYRRDSETIGATVASQGTR